MLRGNNLHYRGISIVGRSEDLVAIMDSHYSPEDYRNEALPRHVCEEVGAEVGYWVVRGMELADISFSRVTELL